MMNHKTIYSISVLIFFSVFLGLFSLTASGAPVIMGVEPQQSVPGESVSIFGSELTPNIELLSSARTFQITGNINQNETEVSFQVPANIPAGEYEIAVTASSGTYFGGSGISLTITVGGTPFDTATATRPNIPTEGLPNFGQLISTIFTWSLNILGIVVFVMIFYAGFQWFTAAGNTAKVNEARDRITNAITGAIVLLAAYIILYTINPDLVGGRFTLPGIGTTSPTPGGGGGGGGGGTGACRDPGGTVANYAGDLEDAIDAVIDSNPGGIANEPNTWENSSIFLGYVAEELQSAGFNATISVSNGNDNPNSGDLIALWQNGDTTAERYDAVNSAGAGNQSMRNAATVGYTGDIPLSCVQQ